MILFAAYTGLRRGECSALEWSDVDFASKKVAVNKTVSNDKEILLPKNDKPRTVVLPPIAEQALRDMTPTPSPGPSVCPAFWKVLH